MDSTESGPTIFETTPIAPDDPLLLRPFSSLSLDRVVEAARIVTEFPDEPAIQQYRRHVVTLRITPREFEQLRAIRAGLRTTQVLHAPKSLHRS